MLMVKPKIAIYKTPNGIQLRDATGKVDLTKDVIITSYQTEPRGPFHTVEYRADSVTIHDADGSDTVLPACDYAAMIEAG
jgi:hypothetical protein